MPVRPSKFLFLLVLPLLAALAPAQRFPTGAVQTRLALEKLGVVGSVLMIGAHPDDERADTLAYFARGRLMRTAYLSVTRGEGGQNLIGPEQGDLLGVIRSQELLDARRIDGAEQFFTRAIDFGYTKSAAETLDKWGRDRILGDIVWVIRRFRPDVVVLCFSGIQGRDGHGQHTASSILGQEAFKAAADPKRFPEQLRLAPVWQAKRLVWNVYGQSDRPGQIQADTGAYNPLLGYSYAEIAALSRSMHHSQGTGMPMRRGAVTSTFVPIAGEPAKKDLFDGIDTTWNRLNGGASIAPLLDQAARDYDPEHPEKTVGVLLEARYKIGRLTDPWARRKKAELDEAVALCAGLWLDAASDRWPATPASTVSVKATALARWQMPLLLTRVALGPERTPALIQHAPLNEPQTRDLTWQPSPDEPYSQPYWLVHPHGPNYYELDGYADQPENDPIAAARFAIRLGADSHDRDYDIELTRPVQYRYVDRLLGEVTRPLAIVPPVAVNTPADAVVFPSEAARKLEISLHANVDGASGRLRLDLPAGWRSAPVAADFKLASSGDDQPLAFEVTPPPGQAIGRIHAIATVKGKEIANGMRVISYPHFPAQVVFPPSDVEVVRVDAKVLARRVGYVMGAGDVVPDALRQLGCEVTLLGSGDLAGGDLSRFDAVVTGVRAYNVRADLRANQSRLLEYVRKGGTLVVQYNTFDPRSPLADLGPYPFRIGGDRVSLEEAPVAFPDPASPLLQTPNRIDEADFSGWVQERGLYFAGDWDPRYKTLFESHDPGEPPHPGGTLYTRYGDGVYVFTAYSWFRQLPAGVPGAYRIFANLLSAARVLK
jgi:LmbE family N-acetylglucosaminyl deacetylase